MNGVRSLVVGFAFAAAGASAQVNAEVAPATVDNAPVAQAEATVTRHPLIETILVTLRERSAVAEDEAERDWLAQMAAYYERADAQPVWVYDGGYLPRGWEALYVLRSAAEYGLDPGAFVVEELKGPLATPAQFAGAEVRLGLAAAKYAWHAGGGRIDPTQLSLWLDHKISKVVLAELFDNVRKSGDALGTLTKYHPRHPGFERLRREYLKLVGGSPQPGAVPVIASGPKLQRGDRHDDVVLIRRRLGVAAEPGDETLVNRELMAAVREFMNGAGLGRKRAIDDEVRAALSKPDRPRAGQKRAMIDRYLVNMERWRWLADDLGAFHVWNNLPEYETRVVKDGNVVHQERVIIGKPKTQTPVFSDTMSHIIFQPDWGIPESIKIRQLLPRLRGGDTSVLARRNMVIRNDEGKEIRPSQFRWSTIDIRSVPIFQRAGPGNPLGRLKFIFPNSHSVYMHDTPDKGLFESGERSFSHGCIRVRNPQRLAEIILGEVEGWSAQDVASQLADKETRKVVLSRSVPVHNAYFTLVADEAGHVASYPDLYGHDKRVLDALNGKPVKLIAANDPAAALLRENKALEEGAFWQPRAVTVIAPPPPAFGFWFAPPEPPKPLPPVKFVKTGKGVQPPKGSAGGQSMGAPPPRYPIFQ